MIAHKPAHLLEDPPGRSGGSPVAPPIKGPLGMGLVTYSKSDPVNNGFDPLSPVP